MTDGNEAKFRRLIAPHFGAGYNLARWLTQSDVDAADILQEASLKAFRFIEDTKPESARAWFFQIIRNTSYTLLKNRKLYVEIDFENEVEDETPSAEDRLSEKINVQLIQEALAELPLPFREILILREFEEMSYEEIAETLKVPLGTVMSRLARARQLLKKKLILKGGVA